MCKLFFRTSHFLLDMFMAVGKQLKDMPGAANYRLDYFPVAARDIIPIGSYKILKEGDFSEKNTAMRRYFYGVRVQVMTLERAGLVLHGAGQQERSARREQLPLDVALESSIYMGAGYTDCLERG